MDPDFAALPLKQRQSPLNNVQLLDVPFHRPRSDLPRTCVANAAYYITLQRRVASFSTVSCSILMWVMAMRLGGEEDLNSAEFIA